MRRSAYAAVIALLIVEVGLGARLNAQTLETLTFEEAVRRAVTSHPTVQQAAAGILRAESILQQVRGRSLPTVDARSAERHRSVTRFAGAASPRTQTVTSAG
jgi:outer membrane protein TolC